MGGHSNLFFLSVLIARHFDEKDTVLNTGMKPLGLWFFLPDVPGVAYQWLINGS
jgi:hypothetical protein